MSDHPLPGEHAPAAPLEGEVVTGVPTGHLELVDQGAHDVTVGTLSIRQGGVNIANADSIDIRQGGITRAEARDISLVIVVDQAEELFTMCADQDRRTAFAEVLVAACDSARH